MKKHLIQFFLVVCSMVVVICFFEIFTRLTFSPTEDFEFKINPSVSIVPHPFFGYTYSGPGTNNKGFMEKLNYPYKKTKDEIVIGIFGGSVAEEIGLAKSEFISEIRKIIPKWKNKKITVLSFALGGYRQPQQFIIASYFADSIDYFINIDGFNEMMVHINTNKNMDHPTIFTTFHHLSSEKMQENPGSAFILSGILYLGSRIHAVNQSLPFLLKFRSYQFVLIRVARLMNKIKQKYQDSLFGMLNFTPQDQRPFNERLHFAADIWHKGTLKQFHVLNGLEKKVLFFIQPNQYVKSSKPFSKWEAENAISDRALTQYMNKAYGYLLNEAKLLQQQGLPVYDLSKLFQNTKETVYEDNCCHLNAFGNQLLIREIVRRLSESAASS